MNSKGFLIAKFGTEEHLKQLQRGEIFFNSINTYRNDGTDYRGDSMEGKVPINPKTIIIYDKDGNNIFDRIPPPESVVQSFVDDDNLMMFCVSTITHNIMHEVEEGICKFNEDFINAVKDFGDYVLLLHTSELLEHIHTTSDPSGQKIGYDSGMILYRDLSDFEHTEEYRKTGSILDIYFVKSNSYSRQNEWRVIIDGEQHQLQPNCGTGFLLKTKPFDFAVLFKTDDFLNGNIEIG